MSLRRVFESHPYGCIECHRLYSYEMGLLFGFTFRFCPGCGKPLTSSEAMLGDSRHEMRKTLPSLRVQGLGKPKRGVDP